MSKIKLLAIGVVGLLILNLGLIAFLFLGQPTLRPGSKRPEDRPKQMVISRLHFKATQIKQYEILIRHHQAAIRKVNDSVSLVKKQLYGSLVEDNFELRNSLTLKLGELQVQIELIHYHHFQAIRRICTPDQLQYFNQLTKDLARFFFDAKKITPHAPQK